MLSLLLSWRLLLIALALPLSLLLARFYFADPRMRWAVYGLVPSLLLLNLTDLEVWALRGTHHVGTSALLRAGSRWILLLACLVVIPMGDRFSGLIWGQAVAALAGALLGYRLLMRGTGFIRLAWPTRKDLRSAILPMYSAGSIMIFFMICSRLDLLMVQQICGTLSAGLFGVVTRVVDGMRLLPLAVFAALIPLLASSTIGDKDRSMVLGKLIDTFCVIGALCGVGLSVAPAILLRMLFGVSYVNAEALLPPLAWSGVFMFVNHAATAFLFARKNHRPLWTTVGISLLVNVGLNLWLLPRVGLVAASFVRFVTEGVMCGILLLFIRADGIQFPRRLAAKVGLLASAGIWCLTPVWTAGPLPRFFLLAGHWALVEFMFGGYRRRPFALRNALP
jgi:O-antigen/teichoic acid export membrane protein